MPAGLTGPLAHFGVRVFFVISGFLITTLLLGEEKRTQTISLKKFYFRRTMRIFPPFYVFIALMALAYAMGWITLNRHDILAAITYTTNYHHDRAWHLGHTWSLAVEEQFYLLWPFLVKVLGSRGAAKAALATIIASPLLRIGLLIGAPSFRPGIGETFPTVADAIATGCLLACHREAFALSPRWMAFLKGPWVWLAPAFGVVMVFFPSAKVDALLGETITNLGIVIMIERVVRFPNQGLGQWLNTRPVVFVGALSYSLYLWQQPFLNRASENAICRFPLNVGVAFLCALASYYLIETPALRLRTWLEKRWKKSTAVATQVRPSL
jgi:peptidoglycan/LPS O-acetylase OafA/YrhL